MKFDWKYKLCLWNQYFDKGMALSKWLKYLLFIIGLSTSGYHLRVMIIIGSCYVLGCFIAGWLWFKYEWVLAEAEVSNRHNLLAREIREKFK